MINFANKNMKVNLNNIILLILLVVVVLLYLNKRRDLKSLETYCQEKSYSYETELAQTAKYHMAKEKLLRDSLDFYKEEIPLLMAKYKHNISYLNNKHKTIKDSINNLPIEKSIEYIDSNFVPTGDEKISINESQVKEIHVSDIECKEVKQINKFQQDAINKLDKAYSNCSAYSEVLKKNLNACESEQKELKHKKNNRTIYGVVVTGLLILVAI